VEPAELVKTVRSLRMEVQSYKTKNEKIIMEKEEKNF
jgi:hypothetical protein